MEVPVESGEDELMSQSRYKGTCQQFQDTRASLSRQDNFLGLETTTTIFSICCTRYSYTLNLGSRGTAVVVVTSSGGVVAEAVVVVVDLVCSLLQDTDHGVERTETILVDRAAGVRVGNRNDSIVDEETDLLGDVSGGAGHDLGGEVGSEGNEFASNE